MSERKKGSTSVSLLFRLTDSTTGAAKAGIDVTTLKLQFERPGAAASTATSLTLLASLTASFTAYGAIEVDATNSKGVYRVDCPDGAFATGADEVTLTVTGTGIEPSTRLIDLTTFDARDVNGNLQGLNGTTAPTTGALITAGGGANQLSVSSGQVTVGTLASAAISSIWNAVTSGMGTVGSIGKKLADWVLGGDSKVLLSSSETGAGLSSVAPASTALSTATWTGTLATNLGTLASHDPGATLATGAEIAALNNLSASDVAGAVWNAATASYVSVGSFGLLVGTDLDATISSRAASSTALSTAQWTNALATNLGTLAGHDPGATIAKAGDAMALTAAYDAAKTAAQAGNAMALTSGERATLAAAILDLADAIETSLTLRQAIRGLVACVFGETSTADTNPEIFKNPAGDTTRVTVANDATGNRSGVTLNL